MLDKIARRMTPEEFFNGIDSSTDISSLGITLKLVDLYAGLEFRAAPRLIDGAER